MTNPIICTRTSGIGVHLVLYLAQRICLVHFSKCNGLSFLVGLACGRPLPLPPADSMSFLCLPGMQNCSIEHLYIALLCTTLPAFFCVLLPWRKPCSFSLDVLCLLALFVSFICPWYTRPQKLCTLRVLSHSGPSSLGAM